MYTGCIVQESELIDAKNLIAMTTSLGGLEMKLRIVDNGRWSVWDRFSSCQVEVLVGMSSDSCCEFCLLLDFYWCDIMESEDISVVGRAIGKPKVFLEPLEL